MSLTLAIMPYRIRLEMGAPLLFRQTRPSLEGQPFKMIKFRTMSDAIDADDRPLSDGVWLNTLSRFLRSISFDELRELWNVLKVDMSLVGSRPLLRER